MIQFPPVRRFTRPCRHCGMNPAYVNSDGEYQDCISCEQKKLEIVSYDEDDMVATF